MAAAIDMSNNRANIAYTGEKPWHSLGSQLEVGASIETWVKEAGLEWEVLPTEVQYVIPGQAPLYVPEVKTFADRKVLYRSDTHEALSVVSTDFKVVQPKQVVEFFRDLVEKHDMKLSTAGSLFGGRRFWALAELGKEFEVVSGDKVKGNLLLTTAVDGTLKTTAKFTSTRVVCNNTLTIALNTASSNLVKTSHRTEWNPDEVKMDLGLIEEGWYNFITNTRKMAEKRMTPTDTFDFVKEIMYPDWEKDLTKLQTKKVEDVANLAYSGIGAELAKGSLWNVVNAITEKYTHGSGKRDPSHQFNDSFYGIGEKMKNAAYAKALELV